MIYEKEDGCLFDYLAEYNYKPRSRGKYSIW
jgi:hypothetical protein